ncbi:Hsp70 family protein [Arvimicrobium flavum]|uniref:Hsp70 family protein n=1 Tax=Arvimicrobium flavum TaxID=3393320 RepID=UPI00237A8EDD|nr:Hsp70 family protein [Mesorhizobium shangrilense]
MKPAFGGIDFGTSNSTVGVIDNGAVRLAPVEGAHLTIPSAIFFNFEDGHTYFGRRAIEDYTLNSEGRLMRSLKSVLGTSLINEKTRVKARSIPFSDIIGMVLGHLKACLDEAVQADVEKVVLGRPVHFVDEDEAADRQAQGELEKAAREQGFKHIEFQFEPIAAALDYEHGVEREELALIADIGGGTSDFSIVRVSPEARRRADRRSDVLANTGVHLGGTDFDRLLSMARVMPELGYMTPTKDGKRNLPVSYFFDLATWQRINSLYSNKSMTDLRQIRYDAARPELIDRMIDIVQHRQGHALAGRVERAKIDLAAGGSSLLDLDLTGERVDLPLTAEMLDDAIGSAVERIDATVTRTLADAGLKETDIDTLFMTGGSTGIPAVREGIVRRLPRARLVKGDVFGSVGLGLALDAQRKFA